MGYDECLAFYSAVLRKPDFGSADADIEWIRAYPDLVGLVCRVRDGDIRQGRVDDVEAGRLLRIGESIGDARERLHDRAGDEMERGNARAVRSGELVEPGGVRVVAEDVGDVDGGGVGASGSAAVCSVLTDDSAPVRGKNYAKNKAKREAAKARKVRGRVSFSVGCAADGDRVRESLEEKWVAENALAAAKARRALEVEQSRDVEQLKRAARTKVQRALERDMVAIERSHATLKATGNVPGVPPVGFAETVVDSVPGLSQDCTISPDSSASQAEVRAMAKANADLEAKLKKIIDYTGVNPDHIDFYEKKVWTETRENNILLNEMYPDGYIKDEEYAPDGKFNLIPI